jgi:cytoskeletal protein RodZ
MTKELIARRLLRVAFLLLMVWLVMWATSCGGKKKLVQKSEFSTEIAKVERVNELAEKNVKTNISTTQKTETHSITENSDVTLTQADPEKEITLIAPDGSVTKIKGANAVISSRKETITKKDTFGQILSNIDKSKTTKNSETDLKEKTTRKNKSVSKEKQGKFPWWWIVIALVIYLAISIFRKSFNPFGWVG